MAREIDERAFRLALSVVTLRTDEDYRRIVRWKVLGQLVAAATSVGANLAEASAAQTKRDFVARVYIARKEIMETQYWLRLLDEAALMGETSLRGLRSEAASIGRVVSSIARRSTMTDRRGEVGVRRSTLDS